ncbi:MAG: glycosyltransferase family 4 protein [Patescibacteria group bacterium]
MKLAQLVSNYFSVPPRSSRAIFQVVDRITTGLVDSGHDVTLFASGDSSTRAELRSVTAGQVSDLGLTPMQSRNLVHLLISKCYREAAEFDLIHSHFNLMSSFYARLVSTPTVLTVHTPITALTRPLMALYRDLRYISFSHSQRRQMPELNWIGNVYHGIDTSAFQFSPEPENFLLFIGRIVKEKGVHLAIEAAKAAGLPLVIAGRTGDEPTYWHKKIEPHIDGLNVRYVGELDNERKIDYFRRAKALLFPVKWEEPFGLVMIEAMACGTPVIGFNRGAVAEIVQDGETGYVVRGVAGMVKAIHKISKISRVACRARVDRLFSINQMVNGYERVYERVIDKR